MVELRVDLDQLANARISKRSYPFLPHVDVLHLRAPDAVGGKRDRCRIVNLEPHGQVEWDAELVADVAEMECFA